LTKLTQYSPLDLIITYDLSMTRIALLTPRLDDGDAVGNDIIRMQELLVEQGFDTRIFADQWESRVCVLHLKKLRSFLRSSSDILIYHYSIAFSTALELFRDLKCVKILRYHNVTPPEFFLPYHNGITNNCQLGREMLPDFIAAGCEMYLCNSRFSCKDIIKAGGKYDDCQVLYPFHCLDRLLTLPADISVLDEFTMNFPERQINILMVGRIVPNKGYLNLIRSFSIYYHHFNNNSKLILVGKLLPELESYYSTIRNLIKESNLERT